jgi:hypothetical protein
MKRQIMRNLGDPIFGRPLTMDEVNNIFSEEDAAYMERNETFMIDTSEFDAARSDFTTKVPFDCYGSYVHLAAKSKSVEDILETIRGVSHSVRFIYTDAQQNRCYIMGHVRDSHDNPLGIVYVYVDSVTSFDEPSLLRGHVSIYGEKNYVKAARAALKDDIGNQKLPTAKWHYLSDGQHHYAEITVDSKVVLRDEYYPFLTQGVEKFIDDYLASNESILILLGPPGTGKSTLLRHMIVSRQLTATLTYEEKLLQQDRLFIQHLSKDGESDVLILEDADVLLESREKCGNHAMNKLLNVSDGIIKVVDKKIVFTTNLPSTTNIDNALLRPGRCYAAIEFRELTFDEACTAAKVANVPVPQVDRNYTLAELFQNQTQEKNMVTRKFNKRHVGFGLIGSH